MMKQGRWSKTVAALVLVSAAMAPMAAQAGDKAKGATIYKDQKCSVCHKVGAAGGKMGPELTKVGGTRDKAWLAKYLANPKAENPKNKMPAVKVKGPDMDHLIAYLLSLK
jgi:cytochrome c2